MPTRSPSKKILTAVPRVMTYIRTEMRSSARSELTVPQLRVLANINAGVTTSAELAKIIGVSPPSMCKVIELLSKRGFIERSESSEDRRALRLALTPKGAGFYKKTRAQVEKRLARRLGSLSAAELATLDQACKILIEVFKK